MAASARWEVFFFSSRRRHTRWTGDWSSDVCSSDLRDLRAVERAPALVERQLEAQLVRRGPEVVGRLVPVGVAADRLAGRLRRQLEVRSEERRVGRECGSGWGGW